MGVAQPRGHLGHGHHISFSYFATSHFCQLWKNIILRLSEHGDVIIETQTECLATYLSLGQGRSQTFLFGGGTGGASFATRGAVNGLCRTSMQWHDVTRKILGGQAKIWGGSGPPWHPPSSAPALKVNVLIGKFIDQTFHIVGRVRGCAPLQIY